MSNDKKPEINPHFFWLDLETTGLDAEGEDKILEVAVAVTDKDLNVVDQFHRVVATALPAAMDPVVIEMHTKSGLFADVAAATSSLDNVENDLAAFLIPYDGQLVLCGSTIHFDRRFIRRYWKSVEARLHYRMVDVSSIKLLARAWWDAQAPKGAPPAHRALADVRASIAELRYWRSEVFRDPRDILGSVIEQTERTVLGMADYAPNLGKVAEALQVVAQVRKDRKAGLL